MGFRFSKKIIVPLLALILVSASAWSAPRPFRVVIDPGHGGADLGAIYQKGSERLAEKDLTLLLSQQVARRLRARGFQVTLTRDDDREVALPTRTALANKLNADVFLSIHMNSTANPSSADAVGIETYILNGTSDASSKRLAHLENSVLGESDAAHDSQENLDVALILKDLQLDANQGESKRLACHVQSQLVASTMGNRLSPRNRGVRQALFHVLLGADMPSVLVEAGFISNPQDRSLVLSTRGQTQMSEAIAAAIDRFRLQKGTAEARSTLSRCQVR